MDQKLKRGEKNYKYTALFEGNKNVLIKSIELIMILNTSTNFFRETLIPQGWTNVLYTFYSSPLRNIKKYKNIVFIIMFTI